MAAPIQRFNVGNIVFVVSEINSRRYLKQKVRSVLFTSSTEAFYDLGLGIYADSRILTPDQVFNKRCGTLGNLCLPIQVPPVPEVLSLETGNPLLLEDRETILLEG